MARTKKNSALYIIDEDTGAQAIYILEPAFEEERTEASPGGPAEVTFSEPITHLVIVNESETDGVFTVNGLTLTVRAGQDTPVIRFGGTPSPVVGISGATSFRILRFD